MRPQGFLGLAFVVPQAESLGLPLRLVDWQEEHILRALLSQPGNDAIGNLIVGEAGRQHFIQRPEPVALPAVGLAAAYAERGLGDWGSAAAASKVNRKKRRNLKGIENEMSLTTMARDSPVGTLPSAYILDMTPCQIAYRIQTLSIEVKPF